MANIVAEQEIRDLMRTWADAVHEGDLQAVLVDHAEDIVMFDVPRHSCGVAPMTNSARIPTTASV